MPSPIEELQSAGFSDSEIGGWATQQRATLSAAGFGEDEIDNYLQGPKPSTDGLRRRLTRGIPVVEPGQMPGSDAGDDLATQVMRGVGAGFKAGMAGEPLSAEKMSRGEAGGAIPGVLAGVLASPFYAGYSAVEKSLRGELATPEEIAPAAMAALTHSPVPYNLGLRRLTRLPTGEPVVETVGDLPQPQDFTDAAKTVAAAPTPNPAVRAKIETLWNDHGIHPAEIAHDIETDPTIAQDLFSSGNELPGAYVRPSDQPAARSAAAPAGEAQMAATPVAGSEQAAQRAPEAAPQIQSFSPNDLKVDPARFQFKEGTDETGVSTRLQGVSQWDPIKAGLGIVWQDEAGINWIADGHQRLGLAKRIQDADPVQQPQLNAWVLKASDGVTDADARSLAAAKNIAEGTGSPVDAAKVLRDRPELLPSIPPRSELVRQAQGLMKLDTEGFGKVVNEVVPANYAAIVGRLSDDPKTQNALLDLLAKTQPENATQAEAIVRQGLEAGLHTETQQTLFGDEDVAHSLYLERAKILDRTLKQLRRDRVVFSTLVDNQSIIEELGNQLSSDENLRRSTQDGQAAQILQTLANRRGPIGDALSLAARSLADGNASPAAAARDFVAELRRQAASGDLARLADGGTRSPVDAAGQGHEPATAAAGPEPHARDVSPAAEARAAAQVEASIRAYHGTPHTFEPEEGAPLGRFNLGKIGTGEGGQSFGHGIYLAEEPQVAEVYRKAHLRGADKLWVNDVGNLYEAHIKAPAASFLDLDEPLGKQSPEVVAGIKRYLEAQNRGGQPIAFPADTIARDWLEAIEAYEGGQVKEAGAYYGPRNAAKELQKVGIAGTRYLDQASRYSDLVEAEGAPHTRNYVVFDPKDIEITGRNGEKLPDAQKPTIEQTDQGAQLVMPGAERSAQQAMEAREAEGHGRIAPSAPQQEPGGMFAPKEPEQPGFQWGPETGAIRNPLYQPPRTPAEEAILSRISIGERGDNRPWSWGRLYTAVVDKLYPISEATGRAAAELGREVPTADNPYQLARLMAGVAGKADHFLNFGTFDWNTYANTGPSLKEILRPVEDFDGLRAFAASVRALELEHRGIETGVNISQAREVAAAGFDKYAETFARLVQYQDRVVQYLRDSGVLSEAAYAGMREANRLYVPFYRVMGDTEPGGITGGSLQASNPVHRIKGSEREIIDPIESIIRNTYLYVTMAERNAVGTKLVDLLHEAGDAHGAIRDVSEVHLRDAVSSPAKQFADVPVTDVDGSVLPPAPRQPDLFPERGPISPEAEPLIRPGPVTEEGVAEAIREALRAEGLSDELYDFVQAGTPGAADEIAIFRNGRRESWRVDPELAASVKALDRQSIGAIEALLAKPASWLRAGAVLNPDFQIRHTFRDYLYAAVTSPGFFSPVDMARGFIGLIAKDADFQNWLKAGGGNISRVALDRRYLQESLRQLNGDTGLLVRAWNVVADPDALYATKAKEVAALPFRAADKFILNPLRMLTELAENASHLGGFKKALRAQEGELEPGAAIGKPEIQAAGFASRDLAVDASRIGAQTRAYNMITAFANITIQDTDRVARAFVNNPIPTALKIGAGIVLPSALLWYANHDDTRYAEIPQWEKDLFWIVMTGRNTPNDPDYVPGHIFRIPKPWGMGVIFGSGTERALEGFVADKGIDALREFGKSIADTVVPQFYPSAAAPIIDQFANRSAFTNRTLVPSELEKQLPEYQYAPYTTETAKRLGQLIAAFPGVRQESLDQDSPMAGGVARALTTPILLENYLRAWSGNLGVYALQLADAALRHEGLVPDPSKPADTLSDIPVIKAFTVRYPSGAAESIQRFYDDYERNKRFFDSWQAKAQEGDIQALQHIQNAGGSRMFVQLDGIKQALSEHSKLIRDIWKDQETPPDQKRQLIDQLYYSEIQIAQAGRQTMMAVDRELAASQPAH